LTLGTEIEENAATMTGKNGKRRRSKSERSKIERVKLVSFLTISNVSLRLCIGEHTIRRAIGRGELRSYAIGGWTRLLWSDVIAWVERHRSTGPQRGPRGGAWSSRPARVSEVSRHDAACHVGSQPTTRAARRRPAPRGTA
jgi:excisionase family DNA binding protein